MSSELSSEMEQGAVPTSNGDILQDVAGPSMPTSKTLDDEAYEPTYAEAFPPLPTPETADLSAAPVSGQWAVKFSMKRTTVTQVFCVPVEERRFKEKQESFGEQQEAQAKIISDIMGKTGVAIEISTAKDMSLTVVITGKESAVMKARKSVVQQLQTQARTTIPIPKEHHRFILGPKGTKLADLELSTATKINIPRPEEDSDTVTIVGTKEGIEKARHEIQVISEEQAKRAFERLHIEKCYHPFICGPDNVNIKALTDETGAKISVPPLSLQKDEIVVSGEKEGVHKAVETINRIYEEKKKKCVTVSVEVKKSQHRYVIGPKGSNLNEILTQTGVSVEVPTLENPSETITLRGAQEQLGPALTMVYAKANSVAIGHVKAPARLHRYIIGKKGASIKKMTEEFPKVHISFHEGSDDIEVEGPPDDMEQAIKALEAITKDWIARMDFAEVEIDQKFHGHIIGRNGANLTRIKEETGVSIRVPPDNERSNVIRIEGSPEGVATAKKELMEMSLKMENEKTRDIIIEQRFHRTIIGQQGSKIKEIRDRFNQVQIGFPDPARKSDVVTLRGPKNDVDKCFRYLQQMHQEMQASSYAVEVPIFKEFHKNVIGKGGATIRKIRDETDTKIDLPSSNENSNIIVITGKKANVEDARARIEAIQKELANIRELIVEIPNKLHNSIIGAKGRLIRSIMEECGGVIIRFPQEGTSDKVTIRGPKDDVEKAKKQLLELANEKKESSYTVEVHAKPEFHRFLIGKGGANVRALREDTGARVIFPPQNEPEQEIITIMGKKESVEAAKKDLEEKIKSLENVVELQINVDPKFHRHFVVRRGEVLHKIAEEYGNVSVSFPRSGTQSDKVTLKGAKECVEAAKKRIIEIVGELESQVTIECVIPQKYHRTVMGAKGSKVQQVTQEFEVTIKFPDRPASGPGPEGGEQQPQQHEENLPNGDTNGEVADDKPKKQDIVLITGKKENCDAARDALLALVPITKEVNIPMDYHRFIIGQRGKEVRQMMDTYNVNISISSPEENSDVIKITGAPAQVEKAEQALQEKVKQIDAERADRALRNHQIEVTVDPKFHPKIIGKKGQVVSKIRLDYSVQIQFPERNGEREDVITITGYEKDAEAAKDYILNIVKEYEDMVSTDLEIDRRVHSRIIGARGINIRKIMEKYKVDVKFPRPESDNPDLVTITGSQEHVEDCEDHLLNLTEEFLQDLDEQEHLKQYQSPPSRHGGKEESTSYNEKGFVVRAAPWHAPDTRSVEEFPEFGTAPAKAAAPAPTWGPRRK